MFGPSKYFSPAGGAAPDGSDHDRLVHATWAAPDRAIPIIHRLEVHDPTSAT